MVYAWTLFDDRIPIDRVITPGYTLCFSYKWYGRPGIYFDAVWRSGAKRMAQTAHKLLSQADAVVHWNGTSFDIPTLNKEFVLLGLTPPAPYKQIDLLKTCRERFRFASNKLDYVSQALGEGAKVEHKGMALWTGCMAGDPESRKTMEAYNKGDVRLTERMYERLRPWIKGHPSHGIHDGVDEDGRKCPACGGTKLQRRGDYIASSMRYARYQCMTDGCGKWSRGRKAIQGPAPGALVDAA